MADAAEQSPSLRDDAPAVDAPVADAPPATDEPVDEPDEDINSKKVTLADLCAKGAALYAHKNYDEAAECYAKAAEQQAEINGEMSAENAEILFLYGRTLFKVGQSKSDVLGGKAAGESKQKSNGAKPAKKPAKTEPAEQNEAQRVTEEGIAIVAAQKEGEKEESTLEAKKPLFQFTGDENWDDDDDDDEEEEAEAEEEEEDEDDLAVAFEVLDLSRVLFLKRLEGLDQTEAEANGKGKEVSTGDSLTVKHIKERLADTHDLLAEISLENERYPNAIEDCRASLRFKQELYPIESEIIAEAHFKLSLALEFASVTHTEEDGGSGKDNQAAYDEKLREEAAKELEAAIESTKMKLQNKEVELATMASPEENDLTRSAIAEVKEIIADMEARLVELRKPPIDVNQALYGAGGIAAGSNATGGILGAALGESNVETEARIQEAKKTATDLSGLVRKKNKDAPNGTASTTTNGNGKRRADDDITEEESKKAKVEDAPEA